MTVFDADVNCLLLQYVLIRMHIIRVKKIRMAILNHISTVLKPGRATLVLGPPGGGKSSLLKAMAGKLDHHNLQVGAASFNATYIVPGNVCRVPTRLLLQIFQLFLWSSAAFEHCVTIPCVTFVYCCLASPFPSCLTRWPTMTRLQICCRLSIRGLLQTGSVN